MKNRRKIATFISCLALGVSLLTYSELSNSNDSIIQPLYASASKTGGGGSGGTNNVGSATSGFSDRTTEEIGVKLTFYISHDKKVNKKVYKSLMKEDTIYEILQNYGSEQKVETKTIYLIKNGDSKYAGSNTLSVTSFYRNNLSKEVIDYDTGATINVSAGNTISYSTAFTCGSSLWSAGKGDLEDISTSNNCKVVLADTYGLGTFASNYFKQTVTSNCNSVEATFTTFDEFSAQVQGLDDDTKNGIYLLMQNELGIDIGNRHFWYTVYIEPLMGLWGSYDGGGIETGQVAATPVMAQSKNNLTNNWGPMTESFRLVAYTKLVNNHSVSDYATSDYGAVEHLSVYPEKSSEDQPPQRPIVPVYVRNKDGTLTFQKYLSMDNDTWNNIYEIISYAQRDENYTDEENTDSNENYEGKFSTNVQTAIGTDSYLYDMYDYAKKRIANADYDLTVGEEDTNSGIIQSKEFCTDNTCNDKHYYTIGYKSAYTGLLEGYTKQYLNSLNKSIDISDLSDATSPITSGKQYTIVSKANTLNGKTYERIIGDNTPNTIKADLGITGSLDKQPLTGCKAEIYFEADTVLPEGAEKFGEYIETHTATSAKSISYTDLFENPYSYAIVLDEGEGVVPDSVIPNFVLRLDYDTTDDEGKITGSKTAIDQLTIPQEVSNKTGLLFQYCQNSATDLDDLKGWLQNSTSDDAKDVASKIDDDASFNEATENGGTDKYSKLLMDYIFNATEGGAEAITNVAEDPMSTSGKQMNALETAQRIRNLTMFNTVMDQVIEDKIIPGVADHTGDTEAIVQDIITNNSRVLSTLRFWNVATTSPETYSAIMGTKLYNYYTEIGDSLMRYVTSVTAEEPIRDDDGNVTGYKTVVDHYYIDYTAVNRDTTIRNRLEAYVDSVLNNYAFSYSNQNDKTTECGYPFDGLVNGDSNNGIVTKKTQVVGVDNSGNTHLYNITYELPSFNNVAGLALQNGGSVNLGSDYYTAIANAVDTFVANVEAQVKKNMSQFSTREDQYGGVWNITDATTKETIYNTSYSDSGNTRMPSFILRFRQKITNSVTQFLDEGKTADLTSESIDGQLNLLRQAADKNDGEIISDLYEALYVAFTKQYDSDDYYIVKTTAKDDGSLLELTAQMDSDNFSSILYTGGNGKTENTKVTTPVTDISRPLQAQFGIDGKTVVANLDIVTNDSRLPSNVKVASNYTQTNNTTDDEVDMTNDAYTLLADKYIETQYLKVYFASVSSSSSLQDENIEGGIPINNFYDTEDFSDLATIDSGLTTYIKSKKEALLYTAMTNNKLETLSSDKNYGFTTSLTIGDVLRYPYSWGITNNKSATPTSGKIYQWQMNKSFQATATGSTSGDRVEVTESSTNSGTTVGHTAKTTLSQGTTTTDANGNKKSTTKVTLTISKIFGTSSARSCTLSNIPLFTVPTSIGTWTASNGSLGKANINGDTIAFDGNTTDKTIDTDQTYDLEVNVFSGDEDDTGTDGMTQLLNHKVKIDTGAEQTKTNVGVNLGNGLTYNVASLNVGFKELDTTVASEYKLTTINSNSYTSDDDTTGVIQLTKCYFMTYSLGGINEYLNTEDITKISPGYNPAPVKVYYTVGAENKFIGMANDASIAVKGWKATEVPCADDNTIDFKSTYSVDITYGGYIELDANYSVENSTEGNNTVNDTITDGIPTVKAGQTVVGYIRNNVVTIDAYCVIPDSTTHTMADIKKSWVVDHWSGTGDNRTYSTLKCSTVKQFEDYIENMAKAIGNSQNLKVASTLNGVGNYATSSLSYSNGSSGDSSSNEASKITYNVDDAESKLNTDTVSIYPSKITNLDLTLSEEGATANEREARDRIDNMRILLNQGGFTAGIISQLDSSLIMNIDPENTADTDGLNKILETGTSDVVSTIKSKWYNEYTEGLQVVHCTVTIDFGEPQFTFTVSKHDSDFKTDTDKLLTDSYDELNSNWKNIFSQYDLISNGNDTRDYGIPLDYNGSQVANVLMPVIDLSTNLGDKTGGMSISKYYSFELGNGDTIVNDDGTIVSGNESLQSLAGHQTQIHVRGSIYDNT